MTVRVIVRHRVNDFVHWKKGYDEVAPAMQQEAGVKAASVHRDLDDPNMVTVYHELADASKAKAFVAMFDTAESQEILKNFGVTGQVEMMLLEDVE